MEKYRKISFLILGSVVVAAITTGLFYFISRGNKVLLFFCRENCSGIRNTLLKDFEEVTGYKVKIINPSDFKNLSSAFKKCGRNVKINRSEVGRVSPFFDCEKEKFVNKSEIKIRIKEKLK